MISSRAHYTLAGVASSTSGGVPENENGGIHDGDPDARNMKAQRDMIRSATDTEVRRSNKGAY
jgi:hypothetical protein